MQLSCFPQALVEPRLGVSSRGCSLALAHGVTCLSSFQSILLWKHRHSLWVCSVTEGKDLACVLWTWLLLWRFSSPSLSPASYYHLRSVCSSLSQADYENLITSWQSSAARVRVYWCCGLVRKPGRNTNFV